MIFILFIMILNWLITIERVIGFDNLIKDKSWYSWSFKDRIEFIYYLLMMIPLSFIVTVINLDEIERILGDENKCRL